MVSAIAAFLLSPAAAVGLKLGRRADTDPPNMATANLPGQVVQAAATAIPPVAVNSAAGLSRTPGGNSPAPAMASGAPASADSTTAAPVVLGAMRPGIVVRITDSLDQLRYDLNFVKLAYRPLMEDMVGKDYVVVKVIGDLVGLHSPDGTQNGVWYFPAYSLKPWLDTADAKQAPVPGLARRTAGLPTDTEFEIQPPSREASPWDYSVKHKKLMDPIAPPASKHVDLEKTSMPLPPFRKVQRVADIDCMEKLHKDPYYICDPEDYVDYVAPSTTGRPPLTYEEGEALTKHIRHLKATIKAMKPKDRNRQRRKPVDEPVDTSPVSMNAAVSDSNQHDPTDGVGKRMNVYGEATDARMNTANGEWRNTDHKPVKMNRELRDLLPERHEDEEEELAR